MDKPVCFENLLKHLESMEGRVWTTADTDLVKAEWRYIVEQLTAIQNAAREALALQEPTRSRPDHGREGIVNG